MKGGTPPPAAAPPRPAYTPPRPAVPAVPGGLSLSVAAPAPRIPVAPVRQQTLPVARPVPTPSLPAVPAEVFSATPIADEEGAFDIASVDEEGVFDIAAIDEEGVFDIASVDEEATFQVAATQAATPFRSPMTSEGAYSRVEQEEEHFLKRIFSGGRSMAEMFIMHEILSPPRCKKKRK